jgi:hypothetical protein
VIVEQGTGNVTLINTFGTFGVRGLPGETNPFTAFLQLIEGIGKYDMSVQIRALEDDRTIAKAFMPQPLTFPNRLVRINVMIPVPTLKIEKAGKYEISVFANDQEVEKQDFQVVVVPQGE